MWIIDFFKAKTVDFPKDTSWLLDKNLNINKSNIKKCKEFVALKNTKQCKRYHKEGNALNHTLLVAKEMHKIISNQLVHMDDRDKRILMISALCHDLGKATTTYLNPEDNDWHCKNHGLAGERITRNLIFNEPDYWMREEICWLVRHHMDFHHILSKPEEKQIEEIERLSKGNSTIEKLLWLNVADTLGSISKENTKESINERIKKITSMAISHNSFNFPNFVTEKKELYKMYVLIGVPGCGKDTYINKFLRNHESISRDDIREEMIYNKIEGRKLYLNQTQESIVTDIVNSKIKSCCENKKTFVINQTNMKKKYRNQLKETAQKYGNPKIVYVYIEAPSIEECKKRRGNGKWDSIIDRMWSEFEFPDRSECDQLIFYKQQ